MCFWAKLIKRYIIRYKNRKQNLDKVSIKNTLLKGNIFRINLNELSGDYECSICYSEFNSDHTIIRLPCNEKHYFHQECIAEWIDRKLNWPLWNTKITKNMIIKWLKDMKRDKNLSVVEMGITNDGKYKCGYARIDNNEESKQE